MENYLQMSILAASQGQQVYCKFLSANDTSLTNTHQSGIYISKSSISILFNEPGTKGENKDKWVKIKWNNDFETNTRFIYYGKGSRNEYRITNFGRGFPFLRPEFTGALFILIKDSDENYQGFVLNSEDEIEQFLDAFGISPIGTNQLIQNKIISQNIKEEIEINKFIASLTEDFPSSTQMAEAARAIQDFVYNNCQMIQTNPDRKLLEWTEIEYRLFQALENVRYGKIIQQGFSCVEDFITIANKVINRRKSRAGKSLEHHLSAIFDGNQIKYQTQAVTEGNKKLDFLFPSQEAYKDLSFPINKIISLAAKTTCKDRWRQVINEADRLDNSNKYLFTLQQGISVAQMDEMASKKVILVVPKPYIHTYPKERQHKIWTLEKFINFVKETESL